MVQSFPKLSNEIKPKLRLTILHFFVNPYVGLVQKVNGKLLNSLYALSFYG